MPNKTTEILETQVTADAAQFVEGMRKASDATSSFMQKEMAAQKSLQGRAALVKSAFLDPATTAKAGLDKLVGSMKLSGVTAGVAAAGIEFATNKIAEWRAEAEAARKETVRFNEEFRKLSQSNTYANRGEGSNSLIDRLERTKEQGDALKDRRAELNPEGLMDKAALHTRYFENYGHHGEEMLETDRGTNSLQIDKNGKEQVKLGGLVKKAMEDQRDLLVEQLRGSTASVKLLETRLSREREIKALESTNANTKANRDFINARYDLQEHSIKEIEESERGRFKLAMQLAGLQASGLSSDMQRMIAAERTNTFLSTELSQHRDNNEERKHTLMLEKAQNQVIIDRLRMETQMKPSAQISAEMQENRDRQVRVGQARYRLDQSDNLVNGERDINGNITDGIDATTGLPRKVTPGNGRATQGLSTTPLGNGSTAAPGSVKIQRDSDAGGGLHLPGSLSNASLGADAARRYLDDRPGASELINRHRGDPNHDPAQRLRDATVFNPRHGASGEKLMERRDGMTTGMLRDPSVRPMMEPQQNSISSLMASVGSSPFNPAALAKSLTDRPNYAEMAAPAPKGGSGFTGQQSQSNQQKTLDSIAKNTENLDQRIADKLAISE